VGGGAWFCGRHRKITKSQNRKAQAENRFSVNDAFGGGCRDTCRNGASALESLFGGFFQQFEQGDQIALIFAYWVIAYFEPIFNICRSSQMFGLPPTLINFAH
jgi:hypothetical protein